MGTITFVCVFHISVLLFSFYGISSAGEQGCFREDFRNNFFTVHPAGYDRFSLDSLKCCKMCGGLKYRYAGILQGRFCFCSQTLPPEDRREPSGCTDVCSGETSQTCGGKLHFTIFDAIQPVRNFRLTSQTPTTREAEVDASSFGLSVDEGINIGYRLDYGDGAGPMEANSTDMLTRQYHVPGHYTVTAFAVIGNDLAEAKADALVVSVTGKARGLEVTCPDYFVTKEKDKCDVMVWTGTDIQLKFSLDGVQKEIFEIPNPRYINVGTPVPSKGSYPSDLFGDGDRLFVMPSAEVQYDAVLDGWLYYATTTGSVHFLVMTPCGTGTYCYKRNDCIGACAIDKPTKHTCDSSKMLCSGAQQCSDAGVCSATARYQNTFTNSYAVKHDVAVTISTVGYGYFKMMTLDKLVNTGDIIAYHGSAIGYINESNPLKADDYHTVTTGTPPTSTSGQTFVDAGVTHLLQAVTSTGSLISLPFTFPTAGIRVLDVEASNMGNTVVLNNVTQLDVAEGVDEVIPSLREYYKTNEVIPFTTLTHMGTDVTYEWNFGDNTVVNTTNKTYSYSYTAPGTYNISVRAMNFCSMKTNYTQVIVQTAITGLSISVVPSTLRTDEDTQINFSMTNGSDFTCTWTNGDSTTNITAASDLMITGDIYRHRYGSQGSKTLFVTCTNSVSSMSKTITYAIVEPIVNLDFVKKGAEVGLKFFISFSHTQGTGPNFTLTVDGTAVPFKYDSSSKRGQTDQEFGPYSSAHILKLNLTGYNSLSTEVVPIDFAVEEKLDYVTTEANASYVLVNGPVLFTITALEGSGVTCYIDYGDGSDDTISGIPGVPFRGPEYFVHDFTVATIHTVRITVSNSFITITKEHTVHVLHRVENLHITHDGTIQVPLLFAPPAFVNFTFHQSPVTNAPTDADVTFAFNDGNIDRKITHDFQLGQVYTEQFRNTGQMKVEANVSNFLSYQVMTTFVKVIDTVKYPEIKLEYKVIPIGIPAKVIFQLYSGPSGEDCQLSWDMGAATGGVYLNENRIGSSLNGQDTKMHTYSASECSSGVTVTVHVTTPLENVTATNTFTCQHPVKRGDFIITSTVKSIAPGPGLPSSNDFDIDFVGTTLPDDAKVRVIFADGKIEHYVFSDPLTIHTDYNTAGLFYVNVTIYNDASEESYLVDNSVQTPLSPFDCSVKYRPEYPKDGLPTDAAVVNGRMQVAAGEVTQFHINTTGTLLWTSLAATLVSNGAVLYTCNKSENAKVVEIIFNEPGDFDISIQGANSLESVNIDVEITVFETSRGLKITNVDISGKNVSVQVDIQSVGAGSKYYFNYGDGAGFEYGGSLSTPVIPTLSYTYQSFGTFSFIILVNNTHSSVSAAYSIPVSTTDCNPPTVDIKDKQMSIEKPTIFKRTEDIVIIGITKINCIQTLDNRKVWAVEKMDENTGQVAENIDVSHLPSYNQAALRVPKLMLGYGYYRFTYSLTMDTSSVGDGAKYESSAQTYVRVDKSDLIAAIADVTEMMIGLGKPTATLSPGKYSSDPDDPDGNEKMTYAWFCKQSHEQIPVDANGRFLELSTSKPKTPTELATNPTDEGGCFFDGPGTINMQNQPSDDELTFYSGNLQTNKTYEFYITVSKDTRSATGVLYVTAVNGNPPRVHISCGTGKLCRQDSDGIIVSRDKRLSLYGSCSVDCPREPKYQWTVSASDHRWPGGWMLCDNLGDNAYGTDSDSLAIEKSFFAMYTGFNKFKVELKMFSDDSTTEGVASMIVKMNEPPQGGNCTVDSTNGKVGNVFRVTCVGWTDTDGIESYEHFATYKDDYVEKALGFGTATEWDFQLPLGPDWDDYYEDLHVRITDKYGSYTVQDYAKVKVNPMEATAILDTIGNVLGEQSDFKIVTAEGDANDFGSQAVFLTSALNSANFDGVSQISSQWIPTSFGPSEKSRKQVTNAVMNDTEKEQYEGERNNRGAVRKLIVEGCKNIALTSVENIKIIVNVLSTTFSHPEECGRDAQAGAMGVLGNSVGALEKMAETASFEKVQNVADKIFSAAYHVLNSDAANANQPMISELQDAEKKKFYDTNDESRLPVLASDDPDAAEAQLAYDTNTYLQWEQTDKVAKEVAGLSDKISKTLYNFMVPGESVKLSTENVIVNLEKNKPSLATNKSITMQDATIDVPPFSEIMSGSYSDDMDVTVRALTVTKPPQQYKKGGDEVSSSSNAISLELGTASGDVIKVRDTKQEFRMLIPYDWREPVQEPQQCDSSFANRENTHFNYQSFTFKGMGKALIVDFCFEEKVQVLALVGLGFPPDLKTREWNQTAMVPESSADIAKCCKDNIDNPCRIFIPNAVLKDFEGKVYLALRVMSDDEKDNYTSKESVPDTFEPLTGRFDSNFSMRAAPAGCLYFDEEEAVWKSNGCRVGKNTNTKHTECFCNHLTTFAGGWVVVPNAIDFDYVFSNMDFMKNITLYATEIVIVVVYILAVIWARRQDKKDVNMLGIAPLKDNDPRDTHFYEIVVVTGMRRNAGTKSKVCFILSGDEDETEVREFADDKRPIFRRGGNDGFLLSSPRPLGSLNYLRIWHDNCGKGKFASWYLSYVVVRNIATDEKFFFMCNRWLAVEEDDGQIDRVVPVAGKEQMTEFGHLFADTTRKNLGDGHLWFSVVARPPTSRFTRVQRVSCCLCLLYMTMLANAMFYETVPENSGTNSWTFGPFSLSPEQVFIGIVTNVLVFPANFLVILLFRKAKPKKKRPSRIQEALRSARPKSAASMADVKPALKTSNGADKPGTPFECPRSDTSLYRPDTSLSIISKGSEDQVHLTGNEDDQRRKKKKKCDLPWWFVIVAWVLLWLLVLVSAAFVTFYGISFKDEKCKKWISSMLIAFFMSVFITQPIKVFLAAIFFSLVIKNPGGENEDEDDEEKEDIKLQNDEEYLHPRASAYIKPKSLGYKPLDTEQLERARERRLKEIKMWKIIREIVLYCFFLWILMVISYRNRSMMSFEYKTSLEKVFILTNDTDHSFSKIRNTADFWVWARSGLVRGIRAQNYYNGNPPLYLRGYINDKASQVMGYAVMRQVRIKKDTCEVYALMKETNTVDECNEAYSVFSEDKGTYRDRWQTLLENDTDTKTEMHYTYRTGSDLNGYPYWGLMEWYNGGGFVYELRKSDTKMLEDLTRMESEGWIDRYTRAVFVEFTVYNPQINMFGIATLLAEMLPSNGFITSYRFEPAMLLPYMSSVMLFQIACEITFFIFTLVFIIRELRELCQKRKQYFKEFWNLVEMSIIGMSVGAICIYFYKLFETNKLTDYFAETHGDAYMKFQYVGYWNEVFSYILGWLVFLATIKFLKLLRFNKKMSLLTSTLRNGANSLIHFSIIFWIFFLAFIQLFYLTFVGFLPSFSTFVSSMESSVLMLMGKFDIYEMQMVEPFLTQIFVFLFLVTVTFLLVNMFLSVLNETFGSVRADITKQDNDYEIVSFMINRFKMWTGIGTATPEDAPSGKNGGPDKASKYRNIEGQIDMFPDRIERLLTSISNVYLQKDGFEELVNSQQTARKGGMPRGAQHKLGGFGDSTKGMTQVHTHY